MTNTASNYDSKLKVISSKIPVNYSFEIKDGRLVAMYKEFETEKEIYYFNPSDNQKGVTLDVLESALEALIGANSASFDVLCACFYGLKHQEQYCDIAIKVFKNHWNKLYNLVIADEVFGRQTVLDNLPVYDFFDKGKQ